MSACAVLFALSSLPSAAHAQGMHVDVPASCGSRSAFVHEVEILREMPLASEPAVDVRIVREGARYRLTLTSEAGVRELEDAHCASLFEAAALMVVVDLERAAAPEVARAPSPSSAEEAAEAPTPVAVPEVVRLPEVERRDAPAAAPVRAAPRLAFLDVFAGLARGPTPAFAARLELGGGLRFGRFAARLSAHYGSPRRVPGLRVQDVGGSIMASVRAPAWLELGLGASAHALPGRGRAGGRDVSLSFGPRAELWFVPLAGRRELAFGGTFTYFPRRPEFVTSAEERLYRAPSIAVALAARGRVGFF